MNLVKKSIICILCFSNLLFYIPASAEEINPYAAGLEILNIFKGTQNGFELSRVPTRAEALAMIIRLIGKEQEALSSSYKNLFSDTVWEEKYVSYGFHNSIIKGISENHFGGKEPTSLQQYLTMLLRVLGYSDTDGDFTYENAVSFASLVFGEEVFDDQKFNREYMAKLSCFALNARIKNSSITLGRKLVDEGIFTSQKLIEAQRMWEQDKKYASTTLLLYTIGSDLESKQNRLSDDLKEILRAKPGGNCNVLIQTGGTITYHNEYMTDGKAERFRVNGDSLQKIDSNIDTKATSPETLTDFIRWGVSAAPAERYILVLWDHGFGIMGGFGADELNERKTMKVSELSSAINNADVFFDIIIFDACLMGTVEVAYALKDHANYLIASEDTTPACGLYYTTWIGALENNPALGTRRLGRTILDSFTLHAGIEANIPTTISMMKLNRVQTLIDTMLYYEGSPLENAKKAKL